mmetsp:Transcript_71297/g.206781  ORF Transcript_71297/g.206781 Transcript_71297/m.206781 type:complete len:214 (-) Transcript_71297:12-653(-)
MHTQRLFACASPSAQRHRTRCQSFQCRQNLPGKSLRCEAAPAQTTRSAAQLPHRQMMSWRTPKPHKVTAAIVWKRLLRCRRLRSKILLLLTVSALGCRLPAAAENAKTASAASWRPRQRQPEPRRSGTMPSRRHRRPRRRRLPRMGSFACAPYAKLKRNKPPSRRPHHIDMKMHSSQPGHAGTASASNRRRCSWCLSRRHRGVAREHWHPKVS